MTTPKELADKAKQLADSLLYSECPRKVTLALHATIDQLQEMAEARQGSGEPDAMPGMSPINREIAYSAAAKLRALGYEWSGKEWQGSGEPVAYPHQRIPFDVLNAFYKQHETGMWVDFSGLLRAINTFAPLAQYLAAPPSAQQATGSGEPLAQSGLRAALAALVKAHDDMHAARRAVECDEPESHAEVAHTASRIMIETRIKEARAALNAAPPSAQQATGSGQVLTDAQIAEIVTVEWRRQMEARDIDATAWLPLPPLAAEVAPYIRAALAAATQAQPEVEAAYHAWAGSVDDEVALRKAVSVCDDILADIADWEDKALAEAVTSVREDLAAMADRIKEDGTPDLATPTQAQPEEERLRAEQAAAVMPMIGPLLDAWEAARGVHEFRDECPELHKMLRAIDNAMEGRAAPTAGKREPLTPAERRRLWNNSPEHHADAKSFTGFERIVMLTERAHGITGEQR